MQISNNSSETRESPCRPIAEVADVRNESEMPARWQNSLRHELASVRGNECNSRKGSLPVRRFPSKHCATLDSVEVVAHGRTDPIVFCTTALRAFA